MDEILKDLGLSRLDIVLLVLCPLFSTLGSFVHFCLLESDFSSVPAQNKAPIDFRGHMALFEWLLRRMFVGGVAGLALALFFVGSLVDSGATVAKVLAGSILVGYAAPKLWFTQEKLLMSIIEAKIKEQVQRQFSNPQQPPSES